MSIVGTRPPLISETNLYEPRHKARLAIKPGITGMWQVSGRSDCYPNEKIVFEQETFKRVYKAEDGSLFPVSVEAVKGYLEFAKNELSITDNASLANVVFHKIIETKKFS